MHRYGDPDFDREYLEWGFHDPGTQVQEAESILRIVHACRPSKILDLACGTGSHAIYWAEQGHQVTAVDLSDTFITEAKRRASEKGIGVDFRVCDITTLDYDSEFDVVTWVEPSFFGERMIRLAHRFLCHKGCFIFDVRNPNHPRTRKREGNWRTWKEEGGIFYLERHETCVETGEREDVWITIDPHQELITEKFGRFKPIPLEGKMEIMRRAGFSLVKLRTIEGADWTYGEEPYWLWVVGSKCDEPRARAGSGGHT